VTKYKQDVGFQRDVCYNWRWVVLKSVGKIWAHYL